jgi:hypothetical protein
VAAAFGVPVVSCDTEARERSPFLLASARVAGLAATLAVPQRRAADRERADIAIEASSVSFLSLLPRLSGSAS